MNMIRSSFLVVCASLLCGCVTTMSADERAIIEYDSNRKCAEPPPSALSSMDLDAGLDTDVHNEVTASAKLKLKTEMVKAYDQSERLLLLQYAMFRVCEVSANETNPVERDKMTGELNKLVQAVQTAWKDETKLAREKLKHDSDKARTGTKLEQVSSRLIEVQNDLEKTRTELERARQRLSDISKKADSEVIQVVSQLINDMTKAEMSSTQSVNAAIKQANEAGAILVP